MKATVEIWRRVYDRAAGSDSWLGAHRWGYDEEVGRQTLRDIAAKLGVARHHHVLEVGCGSGVVLDSLLVPGQRAVGVEPSQRLLRRAAAFGVDVERIRFVAADAARLPLADERFDRVLCYSVFQCFPDRAYAEQAFLELLRVCRPGGVVLVGDVFAQSHHALRESFARMLWALRAAARRRLRGKADASDLLIDEIAAGLPRQHFRPAFFRRLARRAGCAIEVLPHRIDGRDLGAPRFDVRIAKPDGNR